MIKINIYRHEGKTLHEHKQKRRRVAFTLCIYTVHFIILSYFNLSLRSITNWVSLATVCLSQYWSKF